MITSGIVSSAFWAILTVGVICNTVPESTNPSPHPFWYQYQLLPEFNSPTVIDKSTSHGDVAVEITVVKFGAYSTVKCKVTTLSQPKIFVNVCVGVAEAV